ncbi:MAG: DUF6476 family protein [Alphaproteobacteria bacterium]|nr:DUF6476 family protein [Alphaproteobacteria bacterium]
MGGLKSLVVVMGIAIIVGATVVVMTIVQRAGTLGPAGGPKAVELPAGARVVGQDISDKRILLRLRLADGEERLLVIDAESGAVRATFTLRAAGGAK